MRDILMTWRDGDAVDTGHDRRLAKSVSTVYQEQHRPSITAAEPDLTQIHPIKPLLEVLSGGRPAVICRNTANCAPRLGAFWTCASHRSTPPRSRCSRSAASTSMLRSSSRIFL